MRKRFQTLLYFLGIDSSHVTVAEKLIATIGGFIGIFFISIISFQFVGATGAAFIIPSMGASAVLVFAVPHGKLSQPWSLFGGHMISAVIGVACYKVIPDQFLAAGMAVGLAIGAMHVLKCIHPPGGATALAAVIGGPGIQDLGFYYILNPTLLNSVVIFICAIFFNRFFPWRQYPANAMRFTHQPEAKDSDTKRQLDTRHIEQALSDMNLIVDITTDDLQELFKRTLAYSKQHMASEQIKLGHYYTNGKHGGEWSVRHIIDEHRSPDPEKDLVIFRVVEGTGLKTSDSCSRQEFSLWASHELFPNKKQ